MCEACDGGGSGRLGTSAKTVDGRLGRSHWYTLQDTAARLMPHARVSSCVRRPVGSDVSVKVGADGRARYGGLQTCGSVWVCPVCGRRISEVRRRELNDLLHWARSGGHDVRLVTFTVSHGYGDRLVDVLRRVREAKRRWRQLRKVRAYHDANVIGSVSALEVSHGVNGWHPHIHAIFICRKGTGSGLGALLPEWIAAVGSQGGTANGHGFDVRGGEQAGDYVTKWGVAEEVTLASEKRRGGKTPWRLLADAAGGDERSAALWSEFADALQGSRQLVWSAGLRDAAGLGAEVSDQAAAESEGPVEGPAQLVAVLPRPVWALVVRYGLRAWLLDLAEREGAAGVAAGVLQLRRFAMLDGPPAGVSTDFAPVVGCALPPRIIYATRLIDGAIRVVPVEVAA